MTRYNHNDFYGYINKLQEQAIKNPSWFWSDAAFNERQWLRDHNASSIIDTIYENTPDEIKSTINPRYLTDKIKSKNLTDTIHKGQNEFLDDAGAIGLQSAGIAGLGIGLATNLPATTLGFVGGSSGGMLTNLITTGLSKGKYNTWGKFVRKNKDFGNTGNMLVEFTNPGAITGAGSWGALGRELALNYKFPIVEHWTTSMQNKAREDWTAGLEALQRYFREKPSHYAKTNYGRRTPFDAETVTPDVEYVQNEPLATMFKGQETDMTDKQVPLGFAGNLARRINIAADEAQAAYNYAKTVSGGKYTATPSVLKRIYADNIRKFFGDASPNAVTHTGGNVKLDGSIPLWESFHSDDGNFIGIKNDFVKYPYWGGDYLISNRQPFRSVVGHELHHAEPRFNTKKPLTDKIRFTEDSPYYGNDYSRIPESIKKPLKSNYRFGFKVNPHDAELSESFSDLGGTKTMLDKYGLLRDNKTSLMNLLNYKYLKGGWRDRFFLQHPGLKRQYELLNMEIPTD